MTTTHAIAPFPPLLKWAGRKWNSNVATILKDFYSHHQDKTYIEPFCGGLGSVHALNPAKAILGDSNPWLINFYQTLPDYPDYGFDPNTADYYQVRQWFNTRRATGDRLLSALWFYYLNKAGFNGLCRFNQRGEFNVSQGSYKTVHLEPDLSQWRSLYSAYKFVCCDYQEMVIDSKSFLYLDPPYYAGFTEYSGESWGWEQQEQLALWAIRQPCPVVASNTWDARIVDLYSELGFQVQPVTMKRSIRATGDRVCVEMLAWRM
jgi:DNA adenine methylase